MGQERPRRVQAEGGKPVAEKANFISLQPPPSVNLVDMKDEEIEQLVLESARKMAAVLPNDTTVLGVEGITLDRYPGLEFSIWGQWSRACGRAELARDGLVVNPAVFESPVEMVLPEGKAAKTVIRTQGMPG